MPVYVAVIQDAYTKENFSVTVFADSRQEAFHDMTAYCKRVYGIGSTVVSLTERPSNDNEPD